MLPEPAGNPVTQLIAVRDLGRGKHLRSIECTVCHRRFSRGGHRARVTGNLAGYRREWGTGYLGRASQILGCGPPPGGAVLGVILGGRLPLLLLVLTLLVGRHGVRFDLLGGRQVLAAPAGWAAAG